MFGKGEHGQCNVMVQFEENKILGKIDLMACQYFQPARQKITHEERQAFFKHLKITLIGIFGFDDLIRSFTDVLSVFCFAPKKAGYQNEK